MHEQIKNFFLEGEINDSNIVQTKERHVDFLETMMRDSGYVPALDLEPQFTLNYRPEDEVYDFMLTVYGVWVGREEACSTVAGVMSGKRVTRYTHPAK